jgi:hypothetical protein
MKPLLVIAFLVCFPCDVFAQEIYRWVDEKGVVHYGDAPTHKEATPFMEKNPGPDSDAGSQSPMPLSEESSPALRKRNREQDEEPSTSPSREPAPFPGLIRTDAAIDHNARLHLSGRIYNAGPGMCESPSIEVVVFDQDGSADGQFETAAFPSEIGHGEEAQFEGEYLTPVGDFLSWDAIPRCDSSAGTVYGARKRGTVSLRQNRSLRLP